MRLVESLGILQGLGGRKTEASVGIALQVVQVVERWRTILFNLFFYADYRALRVWTERAV